MAKSDGKPLSGTGNGNSGNSGNAGNGTEYIDPAAAITGSATSGDGSGGSGGSVRDATGAEFDPAIHIGPDKRNSDGSFRRKRGRKSGSKGPKVSPNLEASVEVLSRGLVIMHASLASVTNTPELMLDDTEAKGLTEATLNLLALYDVRPDPKLEAALVLAGQVAVIYGTRLVAIRARKSQERAERTRPNTAGVYSATGEPMGTTSFAEYPPEDNLASNKVN